MKSPARGYGKIRILPLLGFLVYAGRRGGLRNRFLVEVATFGDGATLDVPGSPTVTLVPGHTPGSAVLRVPSRNALFAGDALATFSVVSGTAGPQIAPFAADRQLALASLSCIEDVDAALVLPGHGEPWTAGVAAAIAAVRQPESAPTPQSDRSTSSTAE